MPKPIMLNLTLLTLIVTCWRWLQHTHLPQIGWYHWSTLSDDENKLYVTEKSVVICGQIFFSAGSNGRFLSIMRLCLTLTPLVAKPTSLHSQMLPLSRDYTCKHFNIYCLFIILRVFSWLNWRHKWIFDVLKHTSMWPGDIMIKAFCFQLERTQVWLLLGSNLAFLLLSIIIWYHLWRSDILHLGR